MYIMISFDRENLIINYNLSFNQLIKREVYLLTHWKGAN